MDKGEYYGGKIDTLVSSISTSWFNAGMMYKAGNDDAVITCLKNMSSYANMLIETIDDVKTYNEELKNGVGD